MRSLERYDLKYGGRVWVNEKIISFWDYPKKDEWKKFLSDLKIGLNKRGVNVNFDSTWKVEVIPFGNDILENPHDNWETPSILIPVTKYDGSKDVPEKYRDISHIKSPLEKRNKTKFDWNMYYAKGWKLSNENLHTDYESFLEEKRKMKEKLIENIYLIFNEKQVNNFIPLSGYVKRFFKFSSATISSNNSRISNINDILIYFMVKATGKQK
jgi:hypothetical protein